MNATTAEKKITRVEFSRWGLKHDYRGAHVTWSIGERRYLGTVVDIYRTEGYVPHIMFKVRYFCGDDAPDVCAGAVEVLEREYPNA